MKIAYVSFEYPTENGFGGIATYVYQAAQLLANRGHQVEVFTATQQHRSQHQDGNVLVNYVQSEAREFAAKVQPLFAQRHQECNFDVIEGPEYGADAHIIQKLHPQIACVARLHAPRRLLNSVDLCPPQFGGWLRHNLMNARLTLDCWRRGMRPSGIKPYHPDRLTVSDLEDVERDYTQKSDLVVAASHALSEWAIREWSISPSRSIVVPNPYFPSQEMLQMDTETRGMTAGYFGRLQHVKGTDDLVSAIPQILKSEPTVRFRFVGRATIHPGASQSYDKYIRQQLRSPRQTTNARARANLKELNPCASQSVCSAVARMAQRRSEHLVSQFSLAAPKSFEVFQQNVEEILFIEPCFASRMWRDQDIL